MKGLNSSDSDDSVNDTELDDKPPISSTSSMAQLESFDELITAQCCFFIPPENIRKLKGFLMFLEGIGKQHKTVMD